MPNTNNDTPVKSRRARKTRSPKRRAAPARVGVDGGRYAPLSARDVGRIDGAVRRILETIGMAEAPAVVVEHLTAHGGRLGDNGRLTFPSRLIDDALDGMQRDFTLPGQSPAHDMQLRGKRVHVGTGGAAPRVVDLHSGRYRDSTLRDLYDAARLADALDNIHFFSRSLVAGDMPDARALDVNTAYASLAGTAKHVFTSASAPAHVEEIARMCFAIAGSREAFAARPFLSFNVNHVVPPLRYAADACAVMAAAVRLGFAVHANSFGQLGASSPVTIAGSVAQNVAETLAGMIFAWSVSPQAKATFGARPMVTDLRTGAVSGGGGEQAVLMAATTQMAQHYGLANTSIAGATDSKIADAQSGFEKSLSVTLAAQAGSNAITQAAGALASLSACAFESYVIDNDMLGGILRTIGAMEINAETLSVEMIADIVEGDGHFLGHAETLRRMESDFLYPDIADRRPAAQWEADGGRDLRAVARGRAEEILCDHFPRHIEATVD
ncbi:MAG: trimethylamine methyltransferase family protein, partial [bacterium]